MSTPTLYIKRGCPYCAAAMKYLDQNKINYDSVDVRGDEEKMKELEDISSQTRTPTLLWGGKVLANFGVDELKKFLGEQGVPQSGIVS